ncbi:hypothetical protein HYW87_01360, partial [Candidatus Roizmanbacteria bacterium]|nr:hypothetical protein [Candidatus Roizmanbacteria bacterium]
MKSRDILIFFIIFRLIDFLIIYSSQFFIPYLGFFPYKEIIIQYRLPQIFSSLANFDGAHYLLIAKEGYSQYQQAFFPLYPLLIRFLAPLFFNNHLLAGLIISNVAFLLGLFVLEKYLALLKFNSRRIVWALLFLLAFPSSFFFGAVYTEGLFFFLFVSSLYFLKRERYFFASIVAFFASLTRLIGVFLLIPFVTHMLSKKNRKLNFFLLSPL